MIKSRIDEGFIVSVNEHVIRSLDYLGKATELQGVQVQNAQFRKVPGNAHGVMSEVLGVVDDFGMNDRAVDEEFVGSEVKEIKTVLVVNPRKELLLRGDGERLWIVQVSNLGALAGFDIEETSSPLLEINEEIVAESFTALGDLKVSGSEIFELNGFREGEVLELGEEKVSRKLAFVVVELVRPDLVLMKVVERELVLVLADLFAEHVDHQSVLRGPRLIAVVGPGVELSFKLRTICNHLYIKLLIEKSLHHSHVFLRHSLNPGQNFPPVFQVALSEVESSPDFTHQLEQQFLLFLKLDSSVQLSLHSNQQDSAEEVDQLDFYVLHLTFPYFFAQVIVVNDFVVLWEN